MLQVYLRYMIIGTPRKKDREEIIKNPKFVDINDSLNGIVNDSTMNPETVHTSEVVQGYCNDVSRIISKGLDDINQDIFYDKYFMIDDMNVLMADNDNRYYANMESGSGYIQNDNRKRKPIMFSRNDPDDLIRVLKDNNVPINNTTSHINVNVVGWYRSEPINMIPPNFV